MDPLCLTQQFPVIQKWCSFEQSLWWFTLFNALLKSSKIESIWLPSFNPIDKSFVVNSNWLSHDLLFLKPWDHTRCCYDIAVDYVLHDFAAN